jgi:trk system potassium uptake protein TrkH
MTAFTRSFAPVLNVLGAVVAIFAIAMLVPIGVNYFADEGALVDYDAAFLISFLGGTAVWWATRPFRRELQPRDGFLLVTLVWAVLPAFAALPLYLHLPGLSFTDAYFEAASGLTTTGATVLSGLDHLPLSVNVWRCLLQWIGGMGIIVLAVAILPLLGVGGSQVFRAEFTGPMKEAKLTPRIADTAKLLYAIYLGLSALCLLAYRLAGMDWADAFMHMCTTMGIGGFSSRDASFAHWDSPRIEAVAVTFMTLAGINFALHFTAWRARSPLVYLRDPEVRGFLTVLVLAVLALAAFLLARGVYPDWPTSLRYALFNGVSIITTTGYANTDYNQWPIFAPILMLFLAGFATCAGSTGGGVKMIRALILLKQARREFVRILHPRSVAPLTLGGRVIENNVIFAVLAFMLIYGAALTWLTFLLLVSGLDVVTAFTAIVACLNNIGPGLNQVGPVANYASLNDFETWVCAFAMLIGRLELMSVLVLFTPAFWRK